MIEDEGDMDELDRLLVGQTLAGGWVIVEPRQAHGMLRRISPIFPKRYILIASWLE
jgi:hypothetical protein